MNKPSVSPVLCVVLGVVLGAIIANTLAKPCPQPTPPDPIEQARFDSLAAVIFERDSTIKHFESQITQPATDEKLRNAMEFVVSASYSSKLDTLLAGPF